MSLGIDEYQLQSHFIGLGYTAEIDCNAPEAPWENTAVVLSHRMYPGITLVLSINSYTHELVEIERRGGINVTPNFLRHESPASNEVPSRYKAIPKLPARNDNAVTDTSRVSTLTELEDLVQNLITEQRTAAEKEAPLRKIGLSPETINVNREINRGGRDSQRSTQQAKKQVR